LLGTIVVGGRKEKKPFGEFFEGENSLELLSGSKVPYALRWRAETEIYVL